MRREHLFAAFFFAVFAFLLYQFYRLLYFFVGPISWATLLALVFYPLQQHLTGWLRNREGLAAFLLTTAVILIVIVPTIYVSALISTQSVELYHTLNDFVRSGRLTEVLEQVRASRVGRLWQTAMPMLQTWNVDLPAFAVKASNAVSGFLVEQAPAAAANILRFVTNFFLTTFVLFFCFRDGARMIRGLRDLIPMEAQHKDAILMRLYDTLSAVVQGTLVTAFVQGILAGIGFWIVGVRFATLLGGATGFFSLLPFAGPLIWLSVVIYLVIGAAYGKAVVLFLWGTLLVSSADNFLRPLIIGNRTQIPTVFLFFGILGGLQAYGFLGIFLGPALIAILVAFVRIYREQYAIGPEVDLTTDSDE